MSLTCDNFTPAPAVERQLRAAAANLAADFARTTLAVGESRSVDIDGRAYVLHIWRGSSAVRAVDVEIAATAILAGE